jgi:hypothetical protein
MPLKPNCLASAVGSMPHRDAERALDIVMSALPEAPIWPQLSGRGLDEHMEVQYAEGMPRRVIDREKDRMYFDTSGDYSEEFAAFYEAYLTAMDAEDGTGDCSALAISAGHAAGLYALEDRLEARGITPPCIKLHTTGPVSFSLTIVDETKRALYYHEEFRDMIVKALAMKCRWQIQRFRPRAGKCVICFVDEPILSAFGSSTYVSVSREDVVAMLAEVIEAIHADGAVAGVHCCGNTDWSLVIEAGADIVNFDAFDYGETIAMYPAAVKRHLEAGGALAWGVVPTSAAVREQTVDSLAAHYETLTEHLAAKCGIDQGLVRTQTMLTGSCGTGSLEVADAERVFQLTGELSHRLRDRYGFECADYVSAETATLA